MKKARTRVNSRYTALQDPVCYENARGRLVVP